MECFGPRISVVVVAVALVGAGCGSSAKPAATGVVKIVAGENFWGEHRPARSAARTLDVDVDHHRPDRGSRTSTNPTRDDAELVADGRPRDRERRRLRRLRRQAVVGHLETRTGGVVGGAPVERNRRRREPASLVRPPAHPDGRGGHRVGARDRGPGRRRAVRREPEDLRRVARAVERTRRPRSRRSTPAHRSPTPSACRAICSMPRG